MTPEQQFSTEWARRKGILGANEVAGGGLISSRLKDKPELANELNTALAARAKGANAMPVGIEPIHQFERNALTTMGTASPSAIASTALNPMVNAFLQNAQQYGGKADQALQDGMRGFDVEEVKSFFNPAQEAVTNRATARLSKSAEKLRQDLINRLSKRGSATLGDTFGAQQMGDIQEELISKTGDIEAQGAYQNWTDAVSNMMQRRANSLNAGNVYAGMINPMTGAATNAQGIQNTAFATGLAGLDAQQKAGQRIQGFNQGVADISMGNYLNKQGFGNTLTQQAFGAFPTLSNPSMITQTQQAGGNRGEAIGSALGALGGFAMDAYGGNNMVTRGLGLVANEKLGTGK